MGILLLIWDHKELAIILLLSLIVVGEYLWIQHESSKNAVMEQNQKTLETRLKTSDDSIKTLQNTLNDQNAQILKMQQDGITREAAHAAAIAQAKANADNYKKQADVIMHQKPLSKVVCESAEDRINQEILKHATK